MLVGGAFGLAGHVLAVGAAYVTAKIVQPASGGFEDLAAALTVFLATELAVALGSLVYGVWALRTGRRDLGAGALAGWAAGALVALTYLLGLW
jgi:hypothetical protein